MCVQLNNDGLDFYALVTEVVSAHSTKPQLYIYVWVSYETGNHVLHIAKRLHPIAVGDPNPVAEVCFEY